MPENSACLGAWYDRTMQNAARKQTTPGELYKYAVVGLLCACAPPLLAIPSLKTLGWVLLAAAVLAAMFRARTQFGRDMLVLAGALALLGVVPINTDISYMHMLSMGAVLAATVLLPYYITTYGFRERVITFPWGMGRRWSRKEVGYIALAGVVSYLVLPFYLANTGSYLNWSVALDPSHIFRLFVGTNALGIWDEVFFVGVCLALLRKHIPFWWANVAQAFLWTTFLYELGFRGWGSYVIFLFALSQGYIFRRSKSFAYIIAVHLTIDFVLFLTLIHLHHPEYLRIFVTSPF
jgi:membrane protease YdiL (CAAX protease family)